MHIAALFSRVSLHWGYVVRLPGATAAQVATPVPPMTTVVGAFAAPFFRYLGLPPRGRPKEVEGGIVLDDLFSCVLTATKAASAGIPPEEKELTMDQASSGIPPKGKGLAMYQELTKVATSLYRTGGDWTRKVKMKLGTIEFYQEFITTAQSVQAMGASYGPATVMDLAAVLDLDSLAKCLHGSGVRASIEVVREALQASVLGVTRLGSKEGMVSVESSQYLEGARLRTVKGKISTYFYLPEKCVEPLSEGVKRVYLWDTSYRPSPFFVPGAISRAIWVEGSPQEFKIKNDCTGYVLGTENQVIVGEGV